MGRVIFMATKLLETRILVTRPLSERKCGGDRRLARRFDQGHQSGKCSKLNALSRKSSRSKHRARVGILLTGGAALAGFCRRHRETKRLDFFALPGADIDRAEHALVDASQAVGATTSKLQDFREFRRLIVERPSETTIVDLVIDRAPQAREKKRFGRIVVDTLEEISANKLCTVLSRGEPRDLVDLMFLLRSGIDLDSALSDAAKKDGGADAATLAWVVSQIRVGPDAVLPAGVTGAELESFRAELEKDLRRIAYPVAGA